MSEDTLTTRAAPVVVFALTNLYRMVRARFDEEGTVCSQYFGWREPAHHKESRARIVWVPGGSGGNLGEILPPKQPGKVPGGRALATLAELFTVHIGAEDPKEPDDEEKQYEASRALFDAWYRAVYLAVHGTFGIESSAWNLSKKEMRNGTEIICVCWIEARVQDAPYATAPVDTGAEVVTSVEDVSETTAIVP